MNENTKNTVDQMENIGETQIIVKKHPIRDFINNHPAITTITVGILAALGGYAVGNVVNSMDDEEPYDVDYDDVSETVENPVTIE